jgi:hypothetical protein
MLKINIYPSFISKVCKDVGHETFIVSVDTEHKH